MQIISSLLFALACGLTGAAAASLFWRWALAPPPEASTTWKSLANRSRMVEAAIGRQNAVIDNKNATINQLKKLLAEPDRQILSSFQSPTGPVVLAFAKLMEARLDKTRHTGNRNIWFKDSAEDLLARVFEEAGELNDALTAEQRTAQAIALEAADVANLAMMVADVCGGVELGNAPSPSIPLSSRGGEGSKTVERVIELLYRCRFTKAEGEKICGVVQDRSTKDLSSWHKPEAFRCDAACACPGRRMGQHETGCCFRP